MTQVVCLKTKAAGLVAGLAWLVSSVATAADYIDLQVERTVRNIAAVQDYFGVLEQQGLYGKVALLSEVAFRRPHEFRVTVTAPAELAGTRVSYHDNELLTWWPEQELALVVRNFVPPEASGEGRRVADAYHANLDNYFYGLGPVREVAGLPTIQLDQRARSGNQLLQSSLTRVFDNHSFPLAGDVTLRGGAKFSYRWQKIAFNDAQKPLPAVPAPPPSTMTLVWDLAWPARAAADVAARVPKAVAFPERIGGIARDRLLVHPEALPAVAAWYRDDNYYLLVTASRDTGWNPFAQPYGLDVPLGGTQARLVLSPLNSNWSFRRDGLVYTVLTNLHPETAYREIAAQFAPAVAAKPQPARAPAAPGKDKLP